MKCANAAIVGYSNTSSGVELGTEPFLELDDEIGRTCRIEPQFSKIRFWADRDRRVI